jgi:hypothetical protein
VLQDIDDILPARDLTGQQQAKLGDIVKHCQSLLEELNNKILKFRELVPIKGVEGNSRRAWLRFKWDQKDIDEFRGRISSNILLLNTFLAQISR